MEAIKEAGYIPGVDIMLALDVAASELYDKEEEKYNLSGEGVVKTAEEMVERHHPPGEDRCRARERGVGDPPNGKSPLLRE